jgi:hypothetical protein
MKKVLKITSHNRNANQNHNEISPHLLWWLLSERGKIKSVGDIEERQLLYTVGGIVN